MEKVITELKRTAANIPYITVKHNNVEFNFIVDSGCTISCIDENVLDLLVHTDTGELSDGVLFANGEGTKTNKIIKLSFKLNDKEFTETFNALDFYSMTKQVKDNFGITVRGLLGSEFLYKNKLILDFDESIIKYRDNNQLELNLNEQS
jgi:hypothetical protein